MDCTERPTRPHLADAQSAAAHATSASWQSSLQSKHCRLALDACCGVRRCNRLHPAACTAARHSLARQWQPHQALRAEAEQRLGARTAARHVHCARPSCHVCSLCLAVPSLLPAVLCAPLAAMLCPYTRPSWCCAAVRCVALVRGVRRLCVAARCTYCGGWCGCLCTSRPSARCSGASACAHPVVAQTAACDAPPARSATPLRSSACTTVRGRRVVPGDVRLLNRPRAECSTESWRVDGDITSARRAARHTNVADPWRLFTQRMAPRQRHASCVSYGCTNVAWRHEAVVSKYEPARL